MNKCNQILLLFLLPIICINPNKYPKPNIIVVLVDDLGWKDVGFMGSTFYETPNIDRIANKGVVFNKAYSASAVCSPTRAALLTGRYPARIGINDWIRGSFSRVSVESALKERHDGYDTLKNAKLLTPKNPHWMETSEVTLAEILKKNGYVTCHIGKWHLGFDDWYPEKQGFDENYGGKDFGQPPSYFDPYEAGGFIINNLPSRKPGEYLTDREGDEAVKFIKRNANKPFFLNLNHYAVHTPLQAKDNLIAKYIEKASKDSSIKNWNAETDNYQQKARTQSPLDGQRNPTYAAMIENIDNAFGKIIMALEENDLFENTIIIFTSDNGGHIVSTDNSPLRLGKGHPYEGGIRVPLAICYGNNLTHSVINTPICSIDIVPTICELLNVNLPKNVKIDGTSFKNKIYDNQATLEKRNLFWHFPHYWWGTKVKPYSIVKSGKWKLIKNWEGPDFELFDLEKDESENYNLVNIFPGKVDSLNEILNNWLDEVGAALPKKNLIYMTGEK